QLVIKTCADRLDALSAAIRLHHPYELPEIVAISPSAGLPAYLDWIRAQTREET
ncbi:MAG: divalent cation tolerance protein CutA, partial [Stenotrophomonas sp.]